MATQPPISQSQRDLLARLVAQERTSVEALREAGVGQMSRPELARYLDDLFGNTADPAAHDAVDALFESAQPELPVVAKK